MKKHLQVLILCLLLIMIAVLPKSMPIKYRLSGKQINLTSDDIAITSSNFNVDKNGNVELTDNTDEGASFSVKSKNQAYQSSLCSYGAQFEGTGGYVSIDAGFAIAGGHIRLAPSRSGDETNVTSITNGKISTVTVKQSSLESIKKNIEKANIKALEIISNSDIYTYNLKSEKDGAKKHFGFVIGKKYNTPFEVMSDDKEGIDTYSMSSIVWKGIQEQQEQIQKQNELIQSLTSRIEKLEKEALNGKN